MMSRVASSARRRARFAVVAVAALLVAGLPASASASTTGSLSGAVVMPPGVEAEQLFVEDYDDGVLRVLADTFIDFGDGYLDGGVLAWTPHEVERFLLDWVHRKVILEPEVAAHVPRVLRYWIELVLARRGLAQEHIDIAAGVALLLEDEYAAAARDSSLHGPGKEILSGMLAAGVDVSDQDALDEAIGAYNARLIARGALDS